jgi:transcriptional regulator with XRE-family HTH domain
MNIYRSLRLKRNYTQAELAKKLGVCTSAVGMWERGERHPKRNMLLKIARHFDITVDELLREDEPVNTV